MRRIVVDLVVHVGATQEQNLLTVQKRMNPVTQDSAAITEAMNVSTIMVDAEA